MSMSRYMKGHFPFTHEKKRERMLSEIGDNNNNNSMTYRKSVDVCEKIYRKL